MVIPISPRHIDLAVLAFPGDELPALAGKGSRAAQARARRRVDADRFPGIERSPLTEFETALPCCRIWVARHSEGPADLPTPSKAEAVN